MFNKAATPGTAVSRRRRRIPSSGSQGA